MSNFQSDKIQQRIFEILCCTRQSFWTISGNFLAYIIICTISALLDNFLPIVEKYECKNEFKDNNFWFGSIKPMGFTGSSLEVEKWTIWPRPTLSVKMLEARVKCKLWTKEPKITCDRSRVVRFLHLPAKWSIWCRPDNMVNYVSHQSPTFSKGKFLCSRIRKSRSRNQFASRSLFPAKYKHKTQLNHANLLFIFTSKKKHWFI